MKKITQTLVNEINSLKELSTTFKERYDKHKHTIEADLYEDLLYMHTRVKFIFETVKKTEYNGFLNRFRIAHLNNLGKTQIDDFGEDMMQLNAFLGVLKRELENGLLYKASNLIRQEVFEDFMESGKYLLDTGWKDAAAIIIGGVLEDKLRRLSIENGLPIKDGKGKGLSIDPMNINLCKADIYKTSQQILITGWANIRNNAAHAAYDEYTETQVGQMYDFVLGFISEY